uniref:Homing endonuclease n=1 Tax=Didymium iridis TaxID=5793 RepID=Q53I48_9MYCE|nr:homing endonuclease [Didymium iridis]
MSSDEETHATEKKGKRSRRNKNPISPFARIQHLKGLDFIKSTLASNREKAIIFETTVLLANLKHIDVPNLTPIAAPPDDAVKIQCLVLPGSSDTYPTTKVRCDGKASLNSLAAQFGEDQRSFDQTSLPLDLHRLSAMEENDWEMIDDDAIHRCHNKRCFTKGHVYFGSKDQNRSTDFCPAYVVINGVVVHVCTHTPSCLVPGKRAPTTI